MVAGVAIGHVAAPVRGIIYMVLGSALYTVNDAAMKWLTAGYPVGELLALRGVFGFLPLLYLIARAGGPASLSIRSWRWQSFRSVFVVASTFLFITGLNYLPLADAIAIGFASPLFITAMARPFLAEQVGWRRWSAVAVGFVGVIIIIRPGGEGFHGAGLVIVAAALVGAVRDIITRRITATESSLATSFFTISATVLAGLATLPFGWVMPTSQDFALMVLCGILIGVSQYLVIESFRLTEVAVIAPFKYSSLLWAVLFGYLVWGETPDRWTALGSAIVVASGIYILHRETVRRRALARV
ncbi:MAG: DMT family transporter [Alphaproteobacteria bacterium]|nr:DMT family transporter [Alphaproteobacteria bacterium]